MWERCGECWGDHWILNQWGSSTPGDLLLISAATNLPSSGHYTSVQAVLCFLPTSTIAPWCLIVFHWGLCCLLEFFLDGTFYLLIVRMCGKQFSIFCFFLLITKCNGPFYGEVEVAPFAAVISDVPENSCPHLCEVVFTNLSVPTPTWEQCSGWFKLSKLSYNVLWCCPKTSEMFSEGCYLAMKYCPYLILDQFCPIEI